MNMWYCVVCCAHSACGFLTRRKQKELPRPLKGLHSRSFSCHAKGQEEAVSERKVAKCPRSAIPLFFSSATKHPPRDSILSSLFFPSNLFQRNVSRNRAENPVSRQSEQEPTHSCDPLDATKRAVRQMVSATEKKIV